MLNDPGGFCKLITRNEVSGLRSSTDASFFNTGVLETAGVDATMNWTAKLGPGSLNIKSNISYLDEYKTQLNPSSPIYDAKGTLDKGGGNSTIACLRHSLTTSGRGRRSG